MSLDRRMSDESRLRARANKRALSIDIDAANATRLVGRLYSTHGSMCSCHACGNPRKHFNEKTLAEKRVIQPEDE